LGKQEKIGEGGGVMGERRGGEGRAGVKFGDVLPPASKGGLL